MQRLTITGRLIITALILAAIYFGFKLLGGNDLLQKFAAKKEAETEAQAVSPTLPSETSSASSPAESSASSTTRPTFDYTAPNVVNGKMKGVVELGASGFNSFIVQIDEDKHWKLEKAEYGNSLVMENMATQDDIRIGLKKYIAGMLDYGVSGKNIHFVVSSGAVKAEGTQKIMAALKSMNYFVNTVTPEQEGKLGLKVVQPKDFSGESFVADIGSGNTKISWISGGKTSSTETFGAKYFQEGKDDATVYNEVQAKCKQVPTDNRKLCFIIGGVPSELAKIVRTGKERYTVLDVPSAYKLDKAKSKAGLNIYKGIADATGCQKFVFDWDSNFTIGFLLDMP
jgi:hypothetical protein